MVFVSCWAAIPSVEIQFLSSLFFQTGGMVDLDKQLTMFFMVLLAAMMSMWVRIIGFQKIIKDIIHQK